MNKKVEKDTMKMKQAHYINKTMELDDCQGQWFFDEKHNCWCLEDILYTPVPKDARFQRMSIYVPEELMETGGVVKEEGRHVPVVFANCAAGYAQMPHTWLENSRCTAPQYLKRGWVYVTCGCRGRETADENGVAAGKAPATLVDFKTAIRFLRHNRTYLPGDFEQIVSVGSSAGGAMSTLLGVTGDNKNFLPYLEDNGAFMDESDAVYASQIYCPITDLENANMAYEWMFRADKDSEPGPGRGAETMTPFKEALSAVLFDRYVEYFNSLGLKNPTTGETLSLNTDGRSGSGYDYLMKCLDDSATYHLNKMKNGELAEKYSVEDYLSGNYTCMVRGRPPMPKEGEGPKGPRLSLGEMQLRPADGTAPRPPFPMVEVQGADKRHWLSWDGENARVSNLDEYVLNHRRRMKPCTSFDMLDLNSPENEVFGDAQTHFKHFDLGLSRALEGLKERFPEECEKYCGPCAAVEGDADLERRVWLYNPWNYIETDEICKQAEHYRIRVGSCDADTSFMISLTLALKLANAGTGSVDYALVWDQPHCEADYPDEICDWIESIRKK